MGVLELKLELTPKLSEIVNEDVIKAQCKLEKSKLAERERRVDGVFYIVS